MRRTYKSKKDTAGGIDHRDIVLSVDAKSSVFDAFYIQNIKQVKREISCVSSSNTYSAASNKVRKRKYVKRLKEPEPTRESLTDSAYLTPDKSIRVNRAPDLFDQILNSTTTVSSPKSTTNLIHHSQQPKVHARTYCRKKLTTVKKYNYTDSDASDSEKENSICDESNLSSNVSNIKAHKLVIEPERAFLPEYLDDSIKKVVKNLPVLSKLSKENRNESPNRSYRFSSILFNVTHSPLVTNSPQCSTPFHEKHRDKSIYRFSPIRNDMNNSDISLVDKNKNNTSIVCTNKDDVMLQNVDSNIIEGNTEGRISEDLIDINENKNFEGSNLEKHESTNSFHISTSNNSLKNKKFLSNATLQITDCEPFLGFPENNSAQNDEMNLVNLRYYKKYLGENSYEDDNIFNCSEVKKKLDSQLIENDDCNVNNCNKNNSIVNVHIDDTISFISEASEGIENASEYIKSVSMYDTCDSDNLSCSFLSDKIQDKQAIVVIERMSDSTFQKYFNKINSCSSNEDSTNNVSDGNEFSSNIYESDHSNIYEYTSEKVENDIFSKSMFMDTHNDSNKFSSKNLVHTNTSSSENDNSYLSEVNEEENFASFVTTRRRIEISNNSFLLNLDKSNGSDSSPSFNKTVLNTSKLEKSDNIENDTLVNDYVQDCVVNIDKEKTEEEIITNNHIDRQIISMENKHSSLVHHTLNEDNVNVNMRKDSKIFCPSIILQNCESEAYAKPENHLSNEEITNINTRKSSRMLRESIRSSRICNDENLKQGIVLKPGKKWERSLSIYRRMTTMGDAFEHSILDEESLKTKGRKYRQSVISTMEMQECPGSLHNESVISRRSTFVSKPNRSTIKIIKESNASNVSLYSSVLFDDLEGFLNGDCDDTIVELSKLSIGDSDREVTVLDKFHDTSNRIFSARDYVLRRCNQTEPILFDECYPDPVLKNCRKIGEGVYGEVYLWRAGDGRARVMKIVPIAGNTKVNGEEQKGYHEIISEIVIAMELSALRAPIAEIERQLDDNKEVDALALQSVQNATDVFNEVLAVRCVHGSYPSRLLDLWELYDETKGSENDNPAVLPSDQHYLVLELANAGQDLESYQFNNAEQACALFKQIALGLAVAEEELQFEHRDLHWGNVLIAPTDQKLATFVIRGRLYRTGRCGVAATLIDYSLSRASRGGRALYNDLSEDDALFDAVGDYQFEVYRLMRDKLGNDWKNFEPYTNILWLHYTVDKMITALRYTRTNTKIHKHYIAKLKEIKNRVLDYGSATQFVLTDNEF